MRMSAVLALVRLHLRKVAVDRSNLFWLFGMPMMFTLLMGSIFGGGGGGGGTSLAPEVTVYGREAAEFVAALEGHDAFRPVMADSAGSEALARSLVDEGRRTAVLYVPSGYGDSLAAGRPAPLRFFYDPDRASAQTARTALETHVLRLTAREGGRRAAEGDFSEARFDSLWENPRLRLDARALGRLGEDPEAALRGMDNGFQHTGPSYTLMFVLMFMLMSIRDVVTERRNGTLKRLRLGAASPGVLAVGMFLGPFFVGLVQFAVLLGLNALIPGMDYGDSPGTLALLAVAYTGVCAALALLLATFCRTPGMGDGIGMAGGMLLSSLGGLWWPLEIVPGFMRDVGMLLPTGRAVTVFHNMIGRGWGLGENSVHLLWLVGALLVLLALARLRFRKLID